MITIKVALVTACGAKKENTPQPAGKLYKSSRIRHLYRRSKELGLPFYILSAKYGLVNADTVIEPYDKVMTPERAAELLPQVREVIKNFDLIIFYKGGARKEYRELIEKACKETGTRLISFGYGNMGDIRNLDKILEGALYGI
ncbi:DUF6884 domain-containing protein [Thermococcus sp. GR6]|uniref:DUF6884 domain-containing protein n=1 Tax=Thermococcus sp. GR6 TaxID=1638256 RepID=UPI00143085FA|nr:DUF6884 domain-containing protein [Thermococcus sp. GR6]NJE42788.1 hypothetical protein [Thermococcus sp. GR6]